MAVGMPPDYIDMYIIASINIEKRFRVQVRLQVLVTVSYKILVISSLMSTSTRPLVSALSHIVLHYYIAFHWPPYTSSYDGSMVHE